MYRLHYRHVWNLGNFESEGAELERDFDDKVSSDVAYLALKDELLKARDGQKNTPKAETPKPAPTSQPVRGITESQKNFISKLMADKEIDEAAVSAKIEKLFNVTKIQDLNTRQASALIDALQKM